MKTLRSAPRPVLTRDVRREPLDVSQQLRNIAEADAITPFQKALLCSRAYQMEADNKRAAEVRKIARDHFGALD